MSIRVHEYEGDLWVAGTTDVQEAIGHLQTWHNPDAAWNGWLCEKHNRSDCACPTDAERKPDEARVWWFRSVPGCPAWCRQGHKSHWHHAEPHARGAFPCVWWFLL